LLVLFFQWAWSLETGLVISKHVQCRSKVHKIWNWTIIFHLFCFTRACYNFYVYLRVGLVREFRFSTLYECWSHILGMGFGLSAAKFHGNAFPCQKPWNLCKVYTGMHWLRCTQAIQHIVVVFLNWFPTNLPDHFHLCTDMIWWLLHFLNIPQMQPVLHGSPVPVVTA